MHRALEWARCHTIECCLQEVECASACTVLPFWLLCVLHNLTAFFHHAEIAPLMLCRHIDNLAWPLAGSVPLTSMTQSAAWTGDEEPWTNFNDSQLTPVIPNAIMWLVAEAEEVLRNDTWLDLDLALDMSRLQSVAYCHPPNVAAWNCTRQAPP